MVTSLNRARPSASPIGERVSRGGFRRAREGIGLGDASGAAGGVGEKNSEIVIWGETMFSGGRAGKYGESSSRGGQE